MTSGPGFLALAPHRSGTASLLADAARRRGMEVDVLPADGVPERYRERADAHYYGGPRFAARAAGPLGVALLEPHDGWLDELPLAFTGRDVRRVPSPRPAAAPARSSPNRPPTRASPPRSTRTARLSAAPARLRRPTRTDQRSRHLGGRVQALPARRRDPHRVAVRRVRAARRRPAGGPLPGSRRTRPSPTGSSRSAGTPCPEPSSWTSDGCAGTAAPPHGRSSRPTWRGSARCTPPIRTAPWTWCSGRPGPAAWFPNGIWSSERPPRGAPVRGSEAEAERGTTRPGRILVAEDSTPVTPCPAT